MGLVLVGTSSYVYKNNHREYVFKQGEVRHDIPVEVEDALRFVGKFHYVPTPGREVPDDVVKTESNYLKRSVGKIDIEGTPVGEGEELDRMGRKIQPKKREQTPIIKELYYDDSGNVIDIYKDSNGNVVGKSDVDGVSDSSEQSPLKKKIGVKRSLSKQ